jgi:hypothetical protein
VNAWQITCRLCPWSTSCATEAGAAILRAWHEEEWHLGRDVTEVTAI